MSNCNKISERECGQQIRPCPDKPDSLKSMPLAMAYVPWQTFNHVYDPDKALQCGTIFPELNLPFYGKGGCPK
ncbi:MAG: spore coat associated protein CotJA [Lachnospiraceae bacterium]